MLQEFEKKLETVVNNYKEQIVTICVEKINSSLISDLRVSLSSGPVSLKSIASIITGENRTLEVSPWDKENQFSIEQALSKCNIIGSVHHNKDKIICSFPGLNQEERKKFAKLLNEITEKTLVHLRQIRHKTLEELKKQKLSENSEKAEQKKLQTVFDKHTAQVHLLQSKKEIQINK